MFIAGQAIVRHRFKANGGGRDPLNLRSWHDSGSARRLTNEQPVLADRRADGPSGPVFPMNHFVPRVDDRRVLCGIIFINRNGLLWCDAPKDYGLPKALYNRWKRWGDKGFARMMEELASEAAVPKTVMIDATYLNAHGTAISLRLEKGATTSGSV